MNWDRDRLLMELMPYAFRGEADSSRWLGNQAGELGRYLSFYEFSFLSELPVHHDVGWLQAGEFRVVLQTFYQQNSRGTVFVFHGYFDHAGIYHHLIEHLLKSGFSVALYDMPGHGLSSGRRTSISSFTQYQEVMTSIITTADSFLPKPFHAVGQSTGGAVLIDRMSSNSQGNNEPDFDKVVLLAPLVRPAGWGSVKLIHSLVKPFFEVWRRSFSVNSSDGTFVEFLKKVDPLQSRHLSVDWIGALKEWVIDIESRPTINKPVLIVQGTGDKTVEWSHNISVIKKLFSQASVCLIEDGHHHVVNESKHIRDQAFKAIDREFGVS